MQIINKKVDLDHKKIVHSMNLQRSKYLVIQDDIDQIQKDLDRTGTSTYNIDTTKHYYSSNNDKVNLCYMLPTKVNQKRRRFLMFKGHFMAQMNSLKSNGQKIQTTGKIESWIESNIDALYEDFQNGDANLQKIISSIQGP